MTRIESRERFHGRMRILIGLSLAASAFLLEYTARANNDNKPVKPIGMKGHCHHGPRKLPKITNGVGVVKPINGKVTVENKARMKVFKQWNKGGNNLAQEIIQRVQNQLKNNGKLKVVGNGQVVTGAAGNVAGVVGNLPVR